MLHACRLLSFSSQFSSKMYMALHVFVLDLEYFIRVLFGTVNDGQSWSVQVVTLNQLSI
jgi:hypothetical protein